VISWFEKQIIASIKKIENLILKKIFLVYD